MVSKKYLILMSRVTNSMLLRYGTISFWSSSLFQKKVLNLQLQLNWILPLLLRNYFFKILKIQYKINSIILYLFPFVIDKLSFLEKYLSFKKNSNILIDKRKIYGIVTTSSDTKYKKLNLKHLNYITYLTIVFLTKIISSLNNLRIFHTFNISIFPSKHKKLWKKKNRYSNIFFYNYIKITKINYYIKLKLLTAFTSSLIFFYSSKQINVYIKVLSERIQNFKLPFFFNLLNNSEKKHRFYIIWLSFTFLNANFLNCYINHIIREITNNKHKNIIFFLFKNIKTIFLKQLVPLQGIKIQIAGRLNGKLRKSKIGYVLGSVKLMTFNIDCNYSCEIIHTPYGVFSSKIWLCQLNSHYLIN